MRVGNTITFIILASLFLMSCDPGKTLVIEASNKNHTSVSIFGKGSMLPFTSKDDKNRVVITVPENDTTKRTLKYGLGGWPDGAITRLAESIDSIIIIDNSGKSVLGNSAEIESYLKKHRSGYGKSMLKITAKG
jgi:hypothetical protein